MRSYGPYKDPDKACVTCEHYQAINTDRDKDGLIKRNSYGECRLTSPYFYGFSLFKFVWRLWGTWPKVRPWDGCSNHESIKKEEEKVGNHGQYI